MESAYRVLSKLPMRRQISFYILLGSRNGSGDLVPEQFCFGTHMDGG